MGLLIPATIPQVIVEGVNIGILGPANILLVIEKGCVVIVRSRLQETSHSFSSNWVTIFGFEIKVDKGLRPATVPPVTKLTVVDC